MRYLKQHLKQYLKLWLHVIIMALTIVISFTASAGGRMNKFPARDFFNPPEVKLLDALQKGDTGSVQSQLVGGASFNIIGQQGITPLFWLLLNNDKKSAQLALNMGADPNFADGQDRSPVYIFARSIWTDWLEMVLKAGGNPNEQYDGEPVLFAAIRGEKPLENTKLMVAYGADVNLKDKSGRNSVLYAAYVDLFDVALWLAQNGADICTTDTLKSTPASIVKMQEDVDKQFGRSSTPDLLKFKSLLEKMGAYPPDSQTLCR